MFSSTNTSTSAAPNSHTINEDEQYEKLLSSIRQRFELVTKGVTTLFTTNATGLWDAFIAGLPADRRKHYTCNACRRFVERFGGLVMIADDGYTVQPLWCSDCVPPFFAASVAAMERIVSHAKVTGVFVTDEKTWGMPSNKCTSVRKFDKEEGWITVETHDPIIWHHMAVVPPSALVFKSTALKTANQRAAELLQDYGTLCRGLGEFNIDVVRQAHALLASGNLSRAEKCVATAKWLLDLHERRAALRGPRVENITWLATATAPVGFCHVKSSVIGSLLEDIAAGMAFDDIKRRWDAKMDPTQYMRPTAAPSAGNVAQAEKVVAALRSAGALERRFAKLEDIQTIWKWTAPTTAKKPNSGVFGHIKTREDIEQPKPNVAQPAVTMTWEKFQRTVLPNAVNIEMLVPHTNASYSALTTAVHADAPPILQWDREDKRNPVGWYVYSSGSPAHQWNLRAGRYCKVTAVSLQPNMWDPERTYDHQGKSVFFILNGAKDTNYTSGAAFFPETLRNEYHPIRATMEAHARLAVLAGKDEATACGVKLEMGGKQWGYTFRVTDGAGVQTSYTLDRWD